MNPKNLVTVWIAILAVVVTQAQDFPIRVDRVEFNDNVRPYDWTNVEIELEATSNELPDARDRNWVDDVKITVTLAYESPVEKGSYDFYRASLTLISLEVGKDKTVGFWLPREIVERDDLREEPDFWVVQVSAGGQEAPIDKDNVSSKLSDRSRVDNFLNTAAAGIEKTNGYLVPTHLSPYPFDFFDKREPAAAVRFEAQQ